MSRPVDTEPVGMTNTEFIGMADYVSESVHNLLTDPSESLSSSGSNEASHHPSHECFMEDSHSAHTVNDAREATPPIDPGNEPNNSSQASPAPRPDHLRDRAKELNQAMRQLEKERIEVRRQMGCQGGGGQGCDRTREVNQKIANDHVDLPNFAWASQNIAAAAVLTALTEPAEPEEPRKRDKLCTFLERAAQQQAGSSISRQRALSQGHPS